MNAPIATKNLLDGYLDAINASRAKYGAAPVQERDYRQMAEERACDDIGKYWGQYHGGVDLFNEKFEDMVALFGCDLIERAGKIDLCGVTDQWEVEHGLGKEDFIRLRKEIESWIVAHRGRR